MIYRFGDCELDDRRYELRRGGVPCHLEPQVFEVLAYLVRNRDRVVPRTELLDAVWKHRFVTDSALASRVKAARRAVGDSGRTQAVIRTVHGRGFQFLAPVEEPPQAVATGAVDGREHAAPGSATLPHRGPAHGPGADAAARVLSPGPGLTVVGEGALDAEAGGQVRERLAAGDTVVVLAQDDKAAAFYPVTVELAEVATAWGSTVFHFTCDQRVLPSLPERAVLAGEDATVVPTHLLTRVGAGTWPATTVVGAFKPVPDPLAGPVVGALPVGPGRLVTCQYRLAEPARRGDPAALAILGDLLAWAAGGAR